MARHDCPNCACGPRERKRRPLNPNERRLIDEMIADIDASQREHTKVRRAAARARITADKRLGVRTERWIYELAGVTPPVDERVPKTRRLELAELLADKAANNLRKSGHTVVRNTHSGEHEVTRNPKPLPKSGWQKFKELFRGE